jgi:carbamoylphosphate synthase large subunit
LIRFGKDVAQSLKIIGPCNLEVFKKGKNIFLIEVNPRFSAGVVLSTKSGANIPAIALDLFLGNKIAAERLRWRPGIKMIRFWQEVYINSEKVI